MAAMAARGGEALALELEAMVAFQLLGRMMEAQRT